MLAYMYPSDYIVLKVLEDNDGKRMTYKEIGDKVGNIISFPTVVRAIDRLEADNHIRVDRRKGSHEGNEYYVVK